MNPERWERIKELFEGASYIDGEERSRFLRSECGEDAELEAEVERLLSQSAAADDFFRTPGPEDLRDTPEMPRSFLNGQLVCQRFIVRRFIGRGGMGEVYAADDSVTGVAVALKTMLQAADSDKRLCVALRKEVQFARLVTHRNVCRIHDLFEHQIGDPGKRQIRSIQILSMELLEGETLAQMLKARKRFTASDAMPIVRQMAEGLAAVHRAGVIHGDLKPSNVILAVSENGEVRAVLTDFGLARCDAKDSAGSGVSGSTGILGTPRYMSPERLEGVIADVASDIYSLGAIWYEMLTGESPHESPSPTTSVLKRLREDAPSPRNIVADLDIRIEGAILKCLERDPAYRFASVADLLNWFDVYYNSHSPEPMTSESRRSITSFGRTSRDGEQPLSPLAGDVGRDLENSVRVLPAASNRPSQSAADRSGALHESEEQFVREPVRKRRRKWQLPAVCLVLGFAFAAGAWLYNRSQSPQLESRTTPFANYSGYQGYPAFSPDGKQIAYVWNGGGGTVTHIFVKWIGTDRPLQLTWGALSDTQPAWSPDGTSIAFIRALSATTIGVYQVGPLGGQERRVADLLAGQFPGLSWSRDGKWLVTSGHYPTVDDHSRILAISVERGQLRNLSFGQTNDEFSPALSPDSRHLAFSRMMGDSDWEIFVVPVNENLQPSGPARALNTPRGSNRQAVWTADGKDLIFANGSLTTRLWRVSAKSGAPAWQLPITSEVAYQPAVSASGGRFAYAHDFNNANIWKLAIGSNGRMGSPIQTIVSARTSWIWPNAFSPDGQKIAFESNRSGPRCIWIANADGSNPTFLVGGGDYLSGSPVWSPDGHSIAFDSRKNKKVEIYVISVDGGMPRLLTHSQADDMVPCWSHDGKWIYFDSSRTGRFEVFKVSPQGGDEVQVTRNGGWAPQESADGKFLFYTRSRGVNSPLFKMSTSEGQESQVLPLVHERRWVVGNKGIWFIERRAERDQDRWFTEGPEAELATLHFFAFASRTVSSAKASVKNPVAGLAVSQDGTTLLFNQVDHRATEILLMENFH